MQPRRSVESPPQANQAAFLALFLVSGFTGVVFEVLSSKLLGLVMGNSIHSITTVVTSFMAGLALGSLLADRICAGRRPLAVYGALEAGVAACCLAFPALLEMTQPLVKLAYAHLQDSFYGMALVRFVLVFGLLLLPTTLMGATLPVLAAGLAGGGRRPASTAGILYAINSLGAVLGALSSSFLLIPELGLSLTLKVVALADLAVAFIAVRADRRLQAAPEGGRRPPAGPSGPGAPGGEVDCEDGGGAGGARLVVLLVALSLAGFSAMVFEIAWTRALILVLGSSTYAFSMILAAFIGGISLGSWAATRLESVGPEASRKGPATPPASVLVGLLAVISIVGLLTTWSLGRLPLVMVDVMIDYARQWWLLEAVEMGLITLIVAIPATFMGACFPVAVRLVVRSQERLAHHLGRLYGASTLGNIAGAFCAGALFIPRWGIEGTILRASVVEAFTAALVGLAWLPWPRGRRVRLAAVLVAAPLLVSHVIPPWDKLVMSSGAYLYAGIYVKAATDAKTSLITAMRMAGDTIYYKEGVSATVAVREVGNGDRGLVVNGKTDASSVADMKTQRVVGHLPMLLHPAPERTLLIGLGSGVTLASLLEHATRRVDVIEISPEIVEASRYFLKENRNGLADPRVSLTITDARNHLILTDDRYDVIVAEPTNPWIAGVASLFTREFFQAQRAHLKPGGVCAQWVQAYSTSTEDFKAVIGTYRSVFPYVTLWRSTRGTDYILIGSEKPLLPDGPLLARRFLVPGIRNDLSEVGIDDVPDLLAHFLATPRGIDPFVTGAVMLTDDSLRLEYTAPRNLYLRDQPAEGLAETLQEDITAYLPFATRAERESSRKLIASRIHVSHALCYLKAGDFEHAVESLHAAKELAPLGNGVSRLTQAFYGGLTTLLERVGRSDKALEWLREIASKRPDDPELLNELGIACSDSGDLEGAELFYKKAIEKAPEHLAAHKNLGVVYYRKEQWPLAIRQYEKIVALSRHEAKMHNNLGILYDRVGATDKARRSWQTAMELDPAFEAPRRNLVELDSKPAVPVVPAVPAIPADGHRGARGAAPGAAAAGLPHEARARL
jgi:spermidine synthase